MEKRKFNNKFKYEMKMSNGIICELDTQCEGGGNKIKLDICVEELIDCWFDFDSIFLSILNFWIDICGFQINYDHNSLHEFQFGSDRSLPPHMGTTLSIVHNAKPAGNYEPCRYVKIQSF